MSNELQRLSDNIKTLVENTRGAGKVTSENGEVHNDTRTNKAIAEFSFSSGTQNVSGMRAFNIVAVEGTKGKEGKFVLDSVDTPENQKSYQFDTVSTFKYLGTIEIINANDEHWYFDSGLLVSGTTDAELQGAIMYEVVDGVVDETKYDIVNYIGSFDNPPALINTVNGLTSSDYGRKFKLYRDDYKLHKGDLYSIEFNGNYEDCGRIFDIEGNVVTVDSMYLDPTTITEMPEKAYFSVMDKPFAGTTNPMGTGAQAAGYKNKAGKLGAFVTGYNNVAGGKYSFVSGNSNRAGVYSSVSGAENQGTGHAVLVTGMNNSVPGWYNFVSGRENTIKGNDNLVGGNKNTIHYGYGTALVSGYGNIIGSDELPSTNVNGITVSGYNNNVLAEFSLVTGRDNIVTNTANDSMVVGTANVLSSFNSLVSGSNHQVASMTSCVSGTKHTVNGTSNAIFGTENIVNTNNTFVSGILNKVYAESSAVFGGSNKVQGGTYGIVSGGGNIYDASYGLVYGQNNTLKGNFAFAGGMSNNVYGTYALAQGWNNFLYGNNSFSFGSGNVIGTQDDSGTPLTRHDTVFIAGQALKSWGSTQTVFGKYNEPVWSLFHIGNGSSNDARSNAFVVNYNGTAELPSIVNNEIGSNSNCISTKGYVDSTISELIQIGTLTPEEAGATAKIYIQISEQ